MMDRERLVYLHDILCARFSEEELRTLCFYLRIDYDSLPGQGKESKARELIEFLERRGRIDELIQAGQKQRPDIPWNQGPTPAQEETIPSKPTVSVIIFEEDASFSRVIASALEARGLTVAEAHDPQSAIKLARRYRPTAIIIGWAFGDDASRVAKTLRKFQPGINIIGLSAAGWETTEETSAVFDRVLMKPVGLEEVLKALRRE
jgi:CheY-like chemotaxis protein